MQCLRNAMKTNTERRDVSVGQKVTKLFKHFTLQVVDIHNNESKRWESLHSLEEEGHVLVGALDSSVQDFKREWRPVLKKIEPRE